MPYIDLLDGRKLNYIILRSLNIKYLRIKMSARTGLVVIAPNNFKEDQIEKLLTNKLEWITKHLDCFENIHHLLGEFESIPPPLFFNLSAGSESWQVEYRESKSKTVSARTDKIGRILVCGSVKNQKSCLYALKRWLARRAKEVLIPQVEFLAKSTGLQFNRVYIKNQRTRWASCSSYGIISLNSKLLFLSPEQVRYVLIHELCHTLERNHTHRFWMHLRQFEPNADKLHSQMREAWKKIPAWTNQRINSGL